MKHARTQTPVINDIDLQRIVIDARLRGETFLKISRDTGASLSTVHRISDLGCAWDEDLLTINDRSRRRPCICCGRQILSQHSGHRMCRHCASGGTYYR